VDPGRVEATRAEGRFCVVDVLPLHISAQQRCQLPCAAVLWCSCTLRFACCCRGRNGRFNAQVAKAGHVALKGWWRGIGLARIPAR
jgi:hypothetical protein